MDFGEARRIRVAAGSCAICGREADRQDHSHELKLPRDRLCHQCNVGLGFFRDDPRLLQEAARYVVFHRRLAASMTRHARDMAAKPVPERLAAAMAWAIEQE